jgi:hypothetical protein
MLLVQAVLVQRNLQAIHALVAVVVDILASNFL